MMGAGSRYSQRLRHPLAVPRTVVFWRILLSPCRARRNPSCKHGLNRFPIHQTRLPPLEHVDLPLAFLSLSPSFLCKFSPLQLLHHQYCLCRSRSHQTLVRRRNLVFLSVHQTVSKLLNGPAIGSTPALVFLTLSRTPLFATFGVEFAAHASHSRRKLQHLRFLHSRHKERSCVF